jgi:hypothetical protein
MYAWIHAGNDKGIFAPFDPAEPFHPDGCTDPGEAHEG